MVVRTRDEPRKGCCCWWLSCAAVAEGTNGMRQLLGQQRKAEGARCGGGSNAELANKTKEVKLWV